MKRRALKVKMAELVVLVEVLPAAPLEPPPGALLGHENLQVLVDVQAVQMPVVALMRVPGKQN